MKEVSFYNLTEEDAIKAATRMIHTIYENSPRRFELTMSAAIDELPLISASFEGIVIRQEMGERKK